MPVVDLCPAVDFLMVVALVWFIIGATFDIFNSIRYGKILQKSLASENAERNKK